MGKKDSKHKADAPVELTKKERKALKAREAEIEAALAATKAEKKAKKKGKKKGKHDAKADPASESPVNVDPEAPPVDEVRVAFLQAVVADLENNSQNTRDKARKELERLTGATLTATADPTDAELKARVQAKRATREALVATADSIDRDDPDAVKAYNAALAEIGGGRFLTSTAELAKEAARLAVDPAALADAQSAVDGALEEETLPVEKIKGKKAKAKAAADAVAEAEAVLAQVKPAKIESVEDSDDAERADLATGVTVDGLESGVVNVVKVSNDGKAEVNEKPVKTRKARPDELVVEIQTENGREFMAGAADALPGDTDPLEGEVFGKPSEAPKTDFETNGNGQYKIKRPTDGKLVGYTRVTTYISNLESTAQLEAWKMRLLLEGVATHDVSDDEGKMPEPIVVRVRDLTHTRDVAIARARKADRKGKLAVGELASLVDDAWKAYKRALDELAQFALNIGGVKDAATKGTDIHELCELYDREGIDAVGDLLTEGKITPADLADVEAYARAIAAAGLKIDRENIERVVVNDDLKVAGRLDRTALVRLPGSARAVRVVADIKTGRIDYSAGKIGQQLEMYASAKGYDLNTHERTDLKLSRTKAVLIHLPAGTGTCFIYVVDLGIGRIGNKLSGEVRDWRNTGKRAIDTTVDLAKPEAVAS